MYEDLDKITDQLMREMFIEHDDGDEDDRERATARRRVRRAVEYALPSVFMLRQMKAIDESMQLDKATGPHLDALCDLVGVSRESDESMRDRAVRGTR